MEIVTINGNKRTDLGKKSSRGLRREGHVPCVIYGGDDVVHFSSNAKSFKDLVYTPDFKIAEIEVDGSSYKCILKDLQFHPVTDEILHLDFVQLVDKQPVTVNLPVRFRGAAPGVKVGGKLISLVRQVKVKTTPEALVDAVYVDISQLELGQSVRIRDVETVEGIAIMNNPSIPVAAIEIPRALRSAADAAKKAE